jgi:ATP-binding cassette, subfamily A (ABC1), member 3
VLFDKLTVTEHLELVCELKNVNKAFIGTNIEEVLTLVMLKEHRDKLTTELSGGMKRKLSLAMALIGDSKLVVLDEPTSGLDTLSRRQVWKLINEIKQTRSIILSTQHIEEADELCDKVCVLSHGKIVVLQTPDQMKKEFGVGHTLIISSSNSTIQSLPMNDLNALIINGGFIEGAQVAPMQDSHKLAYTIPFDESIRLANLLRVLEEKYPLLLIDIETASLENAYLRIVEQ